MSETVQEKRVTLEVPIGDESQMAEVWETLARVAASFSMRGMECEVSTQIFEVNYLTVGEMDE